MSDAGTVAARVEAAFTAVHETRMQGIPILNLALQVQAVGFRPWRQDWIGVLITPWFMNLMLLPGDETTAASWTTAAAGESVVHALPAGRFSFIVGEEAALGRYQMCSLFSPVFEFGDQETAVKTAEAAIEEVMRQPDTSAAPEPEPDRFMLQLAKGEVELFRGNPPDDETRKVLSDGRQIEEGGDETPLAERQLSRRSLLTARPREGERSV